MTVPREDMEEQVKHFVAWKRRAKLWAWVTLGLGLATIVALVFVFSRGEQTRTQQQQQAAADPCPALALAAERKTGEAEIKRLVGECRRFLDGLADEAILSETLACFIAYRAGLRAPACDLDGRDINKPSGSATNQRSEGGGSSSTAPPSSQPSPPSGGSPGVQEPPGQPESPGSPGQPGQPPSDNPGLLDPITDPVCDLTGNLGLPVCL